MSVNLNSSIHSSIDDSAEHITSAKLRKLKIQETLLRNSINKINPKENEYENRDLPMLYNLEFNSFTTKLKTTFNEITNMFEDIKAQTEEKLNNLDLENMRKDVVKLDDKIRIFKNYLHTELTLVTSNEEELTKQVDDITERQTNNKVKFKTRIPKIKPFNHVVPSPVKVLIKSPLKCKEVQDFQDYMMNSPNRYGGWNEFNHNIFVHIWQKYFNSDRLNDKLQKTTQNLDTYEVFENEVQRKVQGLTRDDIMSHYTWYSKYLYFKEQQRNALNKWRCNQRILTKKPSKHQANRKRMLAITPPLNSQKTHHSQNVTDSQGLLDIMETNSAEEITNLLCEMSFQDDDDNEGKDMNIETISQSSKDRNLESRRSLSDISKPTKQWTSRCNSSDICKNIKRYNNVENIRKLRIPDWRLTLQD